MRVERLNLELYVTSMMFTQVEKVEIENERRQNISVSEAQFSGFIRVTPNMAINNTDSVRSRLCFSIHQQENHQSPFLDLPHPKEGYD